jgi:hypothetical protein
LTITASDLHADSGGQFDSLPSGDSYQIVHVVLVNNSTTAQDYNEFDFSLQGHPSEVRYQPTFDSTIGNTQLQSGTLAPGETVAGDMAFEVPDTDSSVTLYYAGSFDTPALAVPIN